MPNLWKKIQRKSFLKTWKCMLKGISTKKEAFLGKGNWLISSTIKKEIKNNKKKWNWKKISKISEMEEIKLNISKYDKKR